MTNLFGVSVRCRLVMDFAETFLLYTRVMLLSVKIRHNPTPYTLPTYKKG